MCADAEAVMWSSSTSREARHREELQSRLCSSGRCVPGIVAVGRWRGIRVGFPIASTDDEGTRTGLCVPTAHLTLHGHPGPRSSP